MVVLQGHIVLAAKRIQSVTGLFRVQEAGNFQSVDDRLADFRITAALQGRINKAHVKLDIVPAERVIAVKVHELLNYDSFVVSRLDHLVRN